MLEILIAVTAFAIVLAAINAVFYAALRLQNRSIASIERLAPRQRALATIRRDLANIVPPGGTLFGPLQTTSTTNAVAGQVSPEFYTASASIDEWSPFGEIQKVSYALMQSANGTSGLDLVRLVTRNLLPVTSIQSPEQQWLMGGIQNAFFTYYDGTQWRAFWDSTTADPTTGKTNALPQAIKVQINLVSEETGRGLAFASPVELVVPLVVQARGTQTQQTTGGTQ